MSKYQHLTQEEQTNNRLYSTVLSRKKKVPNLSDEFTSTEIHEMVVVDEQSLQRRSYQIHQEKGGTALENWLETEQILKNSGQTVSFYLNEGNPINKQLGKMHQQEGLKNEK